MNISLDFSTGAIKSFTEITEIRLENMLITSLFISSIPTRGRMIIRMLRLFQELYKEGNVYYVMYNISYTIR